MITSVSICNEASFGTESQILDGLGIINFIYGSNGTGKTTVVRVVAHENKFPDCSVDWIGNI